MYEHRRPRPSPYVFLAAVIGVGVAIVAAGSAQCGVNLRSFATPSAGAIPAVVHRPLLVQDSDDDADSEVPPDQVEKYVSVYTDMQRNRGLTIDAAAAKEGLTMAQFRDLEQKIERDDLAREHVRAELQAAAQQKP